MVKVAESTGKSLARNISRFENRNWESIYAVITNSGGHPNVGVVAHL